MLLSKALASSHLLVLCLALCTVTTIHSQDSQSKSNRFITIYPLNKDYFRIENTGGVAVQLFIDNITDAEGVLLNREANGGKPIDFSNKKLTSESKLHIRYTKEIYDQQVASFDRTERRYESELGSREDIDSLLKEYPISISRKSHGKSPNEENLDKLLNVGKNVLTEYMDYKALESYTIKMKELNAYRAKYKAIYEASSSGGDSISLYSDDFKDIPLGYLIRKEGNKDGQGSLNDDVLPQRYINAAFGMGKSSIGTNWDSQGSFRGLFVNVSWEASFNQKLFGDINWGNGSFYSGLYIGVSYDHYVHDLLNDQKNVYVGAAYVDNPTEDFYLIRSEKETTLRTNHFSANVMLHNYLFNGFFIDVGAGFNLYQTTTLHFNKKDKKGDEITHLGNGVELSNTNYRDVVDFDEQSPWYGIIRLGYKLHELGQKKALDVTFFVSSKLQNRNLLPSNDFELYEQLNDDSFQKISITEEEEFFYQISFGVGLSL